MHDGHVHGSCGDCVSFVNVFPPRKGMGEWGYCEKQLPRSPSPSDLAVLEARYAMGDTASLRVNDLGIYRAEEDDACDLIHFRD